MGSLRTSEDAVVVAGEGKQSRNHEDRAVDDGGAKIIIEATPYASAPAAVPRPLPQPSPAIASERRGGLWLVIVVYILASAALAAAIYERFYL